ncbi:hypothetical protein BGZ76_001763 [Entomortierella beljakovae]|nr:hypothetical protein BGZ76_001763 [Entomortierella beljakovae]
MEDAHLILLDLEEARGTAFFAVYDGHGGSNVSTYCSQHLHKHIIADSSFMNGEYKNAILNGYLETDRILGEDPELDANASGCTAVTATITNTNILFVVFDLDIT